MFAYEFHTVVIVGTDEDAEVVRVVAQDVVAATSYDDTAFCCCFLEDDVGLYLEQRFVADAAVVVVTQCGEW